MDKYKLYLGEQILTGDEIVSLLRSSELRPVQLTLCIQVTYRSLSRTLKVHVNLAKQ
jgi:hypothetical protein